MAGCIAIIMVHSQVASKISEVREDIKRIKEAYVGVLSSLELVLDWLVENPISIVQIKVICCIKRVLTRSSQGT